MFADKAMPPKGMTIHQLIFLCGGKAAVARACGVHNPRWSTVPARHVEAVSKLSNLPVEIIRPDLAGVWDLHLAREAA